MSTDNPYARPSDPAKRRSAALTDGPARAGARSMLKAAGFDDDDLARPLDRGRERPGSRRCRATSTSATSPQA